MPWQLKDVILRLNVKTHNTTLEKQQTTINCVIVAQSYARRYCCRYYNHIKNKQLSLSLPYIFLKILLNEQEIIVQCYFLDFFLQLLCSACGPKCAGSNRAACEVGYTVYTVQCSRQYWSLADRLQFFCFF